MTHLKERLVHEQGPKSGHSGGDGENREGGGGHAQKGERCWDGSRDTVLETSKGPARKPGGAREGVQHRAPRCPAWATVWREKAHQGKSCGQNAGMQDGKRGLGPCWRALSLRRACGSGPLPSTRSPPSHGPRKPWTNLVTSQKPCQDPSFLFSL